jgi:hypothetical protein
MALAQSDPVQCLALFKRAVEWAIISVMTTWGAPVAKPERLWEQLEAPIGPELPPDAQLWFRRATQAPEADAELANEALFALESLFELRASGPPRGWSPPERHPIGWSALDQTEQGVLRDTERCATNIVPGAVLWLFGSRATGTANDCSDYDVLLILPDGTPDWMQAQAMGDMWSAGQHHGVEINREPFTASSFDDPTEEDSVLVSEVLGDWCDLRGCC